MTSVNRKPNDGSVDRQEALLLVIRGLMKELHPEIDPPVVSLDSSMDRDLGLDSLARMELLDRLEHTFNLTLPEKVLATAETPRDLLRHLDRSKKRIPGSPVIPASAPLSSEKIDLSPHNAQTLVEVLQAHVGSHPDRSHIILLSQHEETKLTFGELLKGAEKVAAGLQQYTLEPGDTAAIMLPTSLNYFFSFFGILLAGAIPVPLYPPARPTQIEEHLRRHQGILKNAGAKILITINEVKPIARFLKARVKTLNQIKTVEELTGREEKFTPTPIQADDIAFLQYTSGSTGDPKGVVLSHANLLANIRAMGQTIRATSADVFVSWLPLYHDMGLIGAWFGSLYYGCRLVIMSPLSFLARPERWLWAIHKYGGTLSASPNFGYELCSQRINDKAIQGLDLSSWRLSFNGAEPVSPQTITNFNQRFKHYGFQIEAMTPVYGLAESSVGLAFPPLGRGPVIDRIKRETFINSGMATPAREENSVLQFVACGQPLPKHQIKIVDKNGRELPERQEGRLQFKGPSVTSGYFRNPDQTRELFYGEWLDSGDLAYIAGGDIYITSRVKDIIIRGGRNIYPHELEEAVGDIAGIRKGCVAVFGSKDEESGTERVIVLAESRTKNAETVVELKKKITSVAVDLLEMPPDEIIIAPPGTVLKTSSGKIRRTASRDVFEKGNIGKAKRAVWSQVARLALSGILPQLRRSMRQISETVYSGYCWTLFGLVGTLVWLLIMILPSPGWRWSLTRRAARLIILLSGTRLTVRGAGNVPQDQSFLVASNHMSYLDALVLMATLPSPCSFVAKAELAEKLLARLLLSRLDVILVDRFDMERGVEDARKISHLTKGGKTPLFFPEGTLQRMPGLLPFRMGAFLIAAQAEVPIIPVTIRGTRNKLRSGSWFIRRGPVSVTIGQPVFPDDNDWSAAVKLRGLIRTEILRHTGEPDLAGVYRSLSEMEIRKPSRQNLNCR